MSETPRHGQGRKATSVRTDQAPTGGGIQRRDRRSAPGRLRESLVPPGGDAYFKSWCIDRRGRGPGELRAPTDVCFLPGKDSVVVADSGNHRLQVFRGEASAVELYDRDTSPCFHHPTTVALTKDLLHIVTADGDKLHYTDFTGKCLKHWQPIGPHKEDRKVIKGMVLDADDNIVISNFGAKPTVELYSHATSKLIRTLQLTSSHFRSPHYVTCNKRNGLIYVSDYEEGEVHVFDKRAKHCLHSIGRGDVRGKGSSGRLVSPHGMCVDEKGLLYVADKAQNTVSLYMTDTFYQHVLTEAEGLKDPVAISVSDTQKIAVASCTLDVGKDHYAVEVYKKESMALQEEAIRCNVVDVHGRKRTGTGGAPVYKLGTK